MKIIRSGSYRDGGTTYVALDKGNKREVEYQIDYSLPHNGRPRHVGRVYRDGNVSEYEIGSEQERKVCNLIRQLAEEKLGKDFMVKFLAGEEGYPDNEIWSGVCSFLKICESEGKYA